VLSCAVWRWRTPPLETVPKALSSAGSGYSSGSFSGGKNVAAAVSAQRAVGAAAVPCATPAPVHPQVPQSPVCIRLALPEKIGIYFPEGFVLWKNISSGTKERNEAGSDP